MGTIAWSTDPHLDRLRPRARDDYLRRLAAVAGEVLVLTGDAGTAPELPDALARITAAVARPVYFVLGNHDHYGSSIGALRDRVTGGQEFPAAAHWLPPAGVIRLRDGSVLIGVDGWADGRHGDALATPFILNDDRWIAELAAQPSRRGKLAVKQALADADAARLAVLLERAAAQSRHIVVATHVPPFVEALPTTGHLARIEWQPLLVCGATGAVLRGFARNHPAHQFVVLAGHTHVATDVLIGPNLRCRVGGAGVVESITLVESSHES